MKNPDNIITFTPPLNTTDTKGRVLAVGTFDGVHRGHKAVLQTVVEEAEKEGLASTVMTFDRHPLLVVAPDRAPGMLSLPKRRQQLIKEYVDEVLTLHFTEEVAAITSEDWMKWLHDSLKVKTLILGYDNTFGSDGISMEVSDYVKLGEKIGLRVIEAPYVDNVSSSLIRKEISKGEIAKASELLGYPYSLKGIVVKGHHIGRTIGWPTANIIPDPRVIIPGNGVYAAKAILPDGRTSNATVNIGSRPTVSDSGSVSIEAHLHDWSGSLYGLELTLTFIAKIRDEKKFDSLEDLSKAIARDKEETIDILSDNNLSF